MRTLYVLLILTLLTFCNRQKEGNATAMSASDTLCTIIPHLPDTSFSSIDALIYEITIFDTLNSGIVEDLRNPYDSTPGILTFRGGPYRDFPKHGNVADRPDSIAIDWVFKTAFDTTKTPYGIWGGGTGWTGQPLLADWQGSTAGKNFTNREVIVGSLAGKVYFLNYTTGQPSRTEINVVNVIKGTPSLDPSLNGNLYIGQGVEINPPFGAMVIDLERDSITHFVPKDRQAWRGWGAYDSSPIRVGQFLFRLGENGTVYKYLVEQGSLSLHSTLKYRIKGKKAPGIESSPAVYRNYGYFSDNNGNVICFNLNNLKPVWRYDNHDDSDATPVLCEEEGIPYLYTSCEVDKQGSSGYSYFIKLNALTGEKIWENKFACNKAYSNEKWSDGGMFSTPLPGIGDCSNYIFTSIITHIPEYSGIFVAIDKNTGETLYSLDLKRYAWSSPVPMLDAEGKMYIFTADCWGYIYLIEGATGDLLLTRKLGMNFEGSPIIVDNSVIIGSRGREIYKISIY
ncbi:MAG: dehydrogenase [Bacteroidales bacterium]|nr:dehydrogenase [Bacteroidales bacterium]